MLEVILRHAGHPDTLHYVSGSLVAGTVKETRH
jgi:hypothetical protein